jgi:hypothetical protein
LISTVEFSQVSSQVLRVSYKTLFIEL